jgi:hypothetical protein
MMPWPDWFPTWSRGDPFIELVPTLLVLFVLSVALQAALRGVLMIGGLATRFRTRGRIQAWEDFTSHLNLEYYEGEKRILMAGYDLGEIAGTYRGHPVMINALRAGCRSPGKLWMRVQAVVYSAYPQVVDVTLTPRRLFQRGGVASGDAAFDHKVLVRSQPEQVAHDLLGIASMREKMLETVGRKKGRIRVLIDPLGDPMYVVTLLQPGLVTDHQRLTYLLDFAADIADTFRNYAR